MPRTLKPDSEVSRQRRLQRAHNRAGLCAFCEEPLAPGSGTYCPVHLEASRAKHRQNGGGTNPRAWKENKPALHAELLKLDWNTLGYKGVARKYGVTPSCARLWALRLGIVKRFVKV